MKEKSLTMKPLFAAILFCAGFFLHFCSCNQTSPEDFKDSVETVEDKTQITLPAVDPPFENLDVPYQDFKINAVEGEVIKMKNGTVIKVPKKAFVNEAGEPVKGQVTIKYREFHDAAAIIASGIPMANRGDDSKYMETAGMFEIKGEADGQQVKLAPEKELEVNMASYIEGKEFDFFYLDESECNWVMKGTAAPSVNNAKKEAEKRIAVLPEKPSEPFRRNKDNFVFDLDINYSAFPELKAFNNVIWEYAGTSEKDDPEKNPWIFKTDWNTVELQPMKDEDLSRYVLKLKAGDKSFVSYVKPVLSESNYQAAIAEFKKLNNIYQKAKEAMKAERERLKQEADLLREFRVSEFGIYNWDIWKAPQRIAVRAEFDFGEDIDTDMNQISVFLVSGSNRSVVRYTPKNFSRFSFDPDEENKLIAVLPGNKVAVFGAEEFKNLEPTVIRQKAANGESLRFRMRYNGSTITSISELKTLIDKVG